MSRIKLVALVAVLTLVAGCGSGGAEDGTTTSAGGEGTTTSAGGEGTGSTAAGDQVEITLWAGQDYFIPTDNFESFHEAYPNIRVNADVVVLDDVFQTLTRMNDAGQELPDIVQTDGQLKSIMVEAGFARPIGDVISRWEEEDPDLYNLVLPVVWEDGTYDGELVAMADTGTMDLLMYRSDWFEEAGFGPPTTWDELLEAFRAIKAARPDVVPFSIAAELNEGQDALFMQMSAMGIQFEGGIPLLDSEAGHYFINFYQTLSREELVAPDSIAWNQEQARGTFAGGRGAAASDGWSQIPNFQEAGLDYGVHYRASSFPISRDGSVEDGHVVGFHKAWWIIEGTEHPYEASLVLRYLMWPEIVLERGADGRVARHQTLMEDGSPFFESLPGFIDFKDAFTSAVPLAVDTNYLEVTGIVERLLQDMLTNTEEAPETLAQKWQAELDAVKTTS